MLKGYMQDKLNARLMGVARPLTAAAGPYAHPPMPRMTNPHAGRGNPRRRRLLNPSSTAFTRQTLAAARSYHLRWLRLLHLGSLPDRKR
ncbi:hypothetical protein ACNKHQ_18930 [Shigella flexneri]